MGIGIAADGNIATMVEKERSEVDNDLWNQEC